MRSASVIIPLILAVTVSASAQTSKSEVTNWHDVTRDVFVDNQLDRGAQVLVADSPTRLALLSTRLDQALVLQINEKTFSAVPKEAFHLGADRTTASSDGGLELQKTGQFTRIDGPVYSLAIGSRPVLIRPHPGAVGELSLDQLWEFVPVWRAEADSYVPNSAAVGELKAVEKLTKLTLIFGTWCGDSKFQIPRLLRALREAGNSRLEVKLIGVDSQFHEPVDVVQPRQLTNVPTVIVEQDGQEIGRIVETPAADTIEQDLVAILGGRPISHKGRWDRTSKAASGSYRSTDPGGRVVGMETWEMFNTAEGGYLIHSRITRSAGKGMGAEPAIEVFYRTDARGLPSFVEVTRQGDGERDRTRINIDGHTLSARMRGNLTGIVQQTLELPASYDVSSPAFAAAGLLFSRPTGAGAGNLVRYQTPAELGGVLGTICGVAIEAGVEQPIQVPAGQYRARHYSLKTGGGLSELWMHPQIQIPVRGRIGQTEFVLTSLEVGELATPKK